VHTTFGYTFDVSWSPRLSTELDCASGDDPNDGRWGRFNTLFAAILRPHFTGHVALK
jgi:hypothetical protein